MMAVARSYSRAWDRAWPLLIGAVSVAVCISSETACGPRPVSYAEARAVVNRRCTECHSAHPTSRAFPFPPRAVILDTAPQMKQWANRIEARVVVERTMPIANMNGMTDDERSVLGRWVRTGAKIP